MESLLFLFFHFGQTNQREDESDEDQSAIDECGFGEAQHRRTQLDGEREREDHADRRRHTIPHRHL